MDELNNFVRGSISLDERLRTDLAKLMEKAEEYGVRSKEVQGCLTKTIQSYETKESREDYCVCAASLLLMMRANETK